MLLKKPTNKRVKGYKSTPGLKVILIGRNSKRGAQRRRKNGNRARTVRTDGMSPGNDVSDRQREIDPGEKRQQNENRSSCCRDRQYNDNN